ncbi:HAD hydrolase-like protein [Paenibacillus tarimensis]
MLKHVIFDFDGTIVNSRTLMVMFYNELAEKYNFKIIQPEEIEYLSTLSITDRCRVLRVPIYKVPSMGMYAKRRYQDTIASMEAIEGIAELIHSLKSAGLSISIISSNLESSIRTFLKNNNMDLFDHIYSAPNLFGKHLTINAFIKKHRILREETIYIGDEHRDIVACNKAGIRIITVTWGFDSVELLSKARPDFVVHTLLELNRLLHEMSSKLI